eukprot:gene5750-6656_t
MAQRLTYRRRLSYRTESNKVKVVKTPGGKLVYQYVGKRGQVPKCGECGTQLAGIKCLKSFELKNVAKCHRTVDRAYGGSKCARCVRTRIVRAFLIEEQKTAKLVYKKQQKEKKTKVTKESKISAKSEFFRMLLTNGMRETTQQEITIPNVPVDIFFEVLLFLYTSGMSIHTDTLNRTFLSNELYMKEINVFQSTMEWIKSNLCGDYSSLENKQTLNEMFQSIRFPIMEYEELITQVEPTMIVPPMLLLEAYRYLSKPKMFPLEENLLSNLRLQPRKRLDPPLTPGADVYSILCPDHQKCSSVSWTITNFSTIKMQKHVSNAFEIMGLKWKMWAYPAGEAKHSDSFSVYLEAIRVKEKESYDFLRNTTFFFALVNQRNKTLSKHYPSSPNVLFNYEKSVWGNGLIELKQLYDPSLGYMDNDSVCIQLHILECIALEG